MKYNTFAASKTLVEPKWISSKDVADSAKDL